MRFMMPSRTTFNCGGLKLISMKFLREEFGLELMHCPLVSLMRWPPQMSKCMVMVILHLTLHILNLTLTTTNYYCSLESLFRYIQHCVSDTNRTVLLVKQSSARKYRCEWVSVAVLWWKNGLFFITAHLSFVVVVVVFVLFAWIQV